MYVLGITVVQTRGEARNADRKKGGGQADRRDGRKGSSETREERGQEDLLQNGELEPLVTAEADGFAYNLLHIVNNVVSTAILDL